MEKKQANEVELYSIDLKNRNESAKIKLAYAKALEESILRETRKIEQEIKDQVVQKENKTYFNNKFDNRYKLRDLEKNLAEEEVRITEMLTIQRQDIAIERRKNTNCFSESSQVDQYSVTETNLQYATNIGLNLLQQLRYLRLQLSEKEDLHKKLSVDNAHLIKQLDLLSSNMKTLMKEKTKVQGQRDLLEQRLQGLMKKLTEVESLTVSLNDEKNKLTLELTNLRICLHELQLNAEKGETIDESEDSKNTLVTEDENDDSVFLESSSDKYFDSSSFDAEQEEKYDFPIDPFLSLESNVQTSVSQSSAVLKSINLAKQELVSVNHLVADDTKTPSPNLSSEIIENTKADIKKSIRSLNKAVSPENSIDIEDETDRDDEFICFLLSYQQLQKALKSNLGLFQLSGLYPLSLNHLIQSFFQSLTSQISIKDIDSKNKQVIKLFKPTKSSDRQEIFELAQFEPRQKFPIDMNSSKCDMSASTEMHLKDTEKFANFKLKENVLNHSSIYERDVSYLPALNKGGRENYLNNRVSSYRLVKPILSSYGNHVLNRIQHDILENHFCCLKNVKDFVCGANTISMQWNLQKNMEFISSVFSLIKNEVNDTSANSVILRTDALSNVATTRLKRKLTSAIIDCSIPRRRLRHYSNPEIAEFKNFRLSTDISHSNVRNSKKLCSNGSMNCMRQGKAVFPRKIPYQEHDWEQWEKIAQSSMFKNRSIASRQSLETSDVTLDINMSSRHSNGTSSMLFKDFTKHNNWEASTYPSAPKNTRTYPTAEVEKTRLDSSQSARQLKARSTATTISISLSTVSDVFTLPRNNLKSKTNTKNCRDNLNLSGLSSSTCNANSVNKLMKHVMMGNEMMKYPRSESFKMFKKSHWRYFWINPHCEMLCWSKTNPFIEKGRKNQVKSVKIKGMTIIKAPDALKNANLHNEVIVMQTTDKPIVLKAKSKKIHNIWVQAIKQINHKAIFDTKPGI
ncbi:hypothetical protein POMI540_4431 [Schizosaccharomyces pombe]